MGLRVGWLVLVEVHFGFGREREEGERVARRRGS